MKTLRLSWILTLGILLACSSEKALEQSEEIPDMAANSRNSLDWNGVYQGTIPCADCEGIETSITIQSNGEFKRTMVYLGKDDTKIFEDGTFEWNDMGSKITLISESGDRQMYQVGENVLFHLNQDGNRITGDLEENYRLAKNPTDPRLEGKKWVLTELKGESVSFGEDQNEAFLLFDMETSMFSGSGSCNNIFGAYELKGDGRISFGNAASTMMACPDMEVETAFVQIIPNLTHYEIGDDGMLSLREANSESLTKFKQAE